MYRDISSLENIKMDRANATNQFTEVNVKLKLLYTQISLKENSICTIENFIEKYLPVRVLTQVSEILNKMFVKGDCPEIKRLNKYERFQYRLYNENILNDNGLPDIMQSIMDTKNRLQNSINKLNITDLAKTQKMNKNGGKVDNIV